MVIKTIQIPVDEETHKKIIELKFRYKATNWGEFFEKLLQDPRLQEDGN